MKKLTIIVAILGMILAACGGSSEWNRYEDWRKYNNEWLEEMQALKSPDGSPYYRTLVPTWNPGVFVLIHYYNDRAETEGNLSPLYTSTIDVRYKLYDCNDQLVDSSTNITAYGDGIARFKLSDLVTGWAIAMEEIRCGDTCELIVPYNVGYGSSNINVLKPYSNLRFQLRLVDIPFYEVEK